LDSQKRGRVFEQEEGADPSKSTGSPDDLLNDDDDFLPKTKRKHGAAAHAAGWRDDQPLIGSISADIQKLDRLPSSFGFVFGSCYKR
jgi:hypothetical protein